MTRHWVGILLLGALGCDKAGPDEPFVSRADGALPQLVVARVADDAIAIDGALDEDAWKNAASSGPFVSPGNGEPAKKSKVNATAKLAWSEAHLFVAVTVWDGAASTPLAKDAVDPHVWANASGIELMLQPGDKGDNRDYYELQVDVGGAVWDTHFDDYNRPISGGPDDEHKRFGHQEWSSGVKRATQKHSDRYVVELALPWRAIEKARTPVPPRAGDVWRANLYSFRDGQADSLAWSPILGQGNFHRAARFGRLRFQ